MSAKRLSFIVGALVICSLVFGSIRLLAASKRGDIDQSRLATPKNAVLSPSGKYVLGVKENTVNGSKTWSFVISKSLSEGAESGIVFTSAEEFRTRDTLFLLWDDRDRVWVYSGDVGTFYWEQVPSGDWNKRTFADNKDTPVPSLLQQLKPGYFDSSQ